MNVPGVGEIPAAVQEKRVALRQLLHQYPSALVAFSGGADSAYLLAEAASVLGRRVVALTAVSPSLLESEVKSAEEFARALGVRHELVASHELEDPGYVKNSPDRCYHCKSELYRLADGVRKALVLHAVLDGFNADDERDHRPGHQAAQERGVISPLSAVRLAKSEIRLLSRAMGLSTWDKPAMPCLASRLPYGTAVTAERLTRVGRAETALRALGLKNFRVRYHGDVARIEVSVEERARFDDPSFRQRADSGVKSAGFVFAAVDLEPFRSGRLNEAAGVLPVVTHADVSGAGSSLKHSTIPS